MLISKNDAIALAAIGTFAAVTTVIVLPQIQTEVKNALELNVKKSASSEPKKITAKPKGNSKDFGADDLVAGTLLVGVVWAITKN